MATKINNDGPKGCKCKKSQCVKLYCDCFAAELYCNEDCSCMECFNRLDYEDTVEVAREKIKARDPLAFDPKIHPVEGGNQVMPMVGKHRKGCSCKNSLCSQLYCECYKANVGCSGGCRCEGCQNSYGKKGEYNVYNAPHIRRDINEKPNDNEKTTLEFNRLEFSPVGNHYVQSSIPSTTFQYPDYRNIDTSTTRTYIPSPGSANSVMIGTSRREFDMVPLNQQSYPYVDQFTGNEFTPRQINEMLELDPNDALIYTFNNNTTPYTK